MPQKIKISINNYCSYKLFVIKILIKIITYLIVMDQSYGLRYEPIKTSVLCETTKVWFQDLIRKAFPIDVLLNKSSSNITLALSDYQLMNYSLETLKPIWTVPNAHRKKITSLCKVDEKTIASSSSDSSVKIWDIASGKLVHTFKSDL